MFTALLAWLFSRRNTVDAADYCGMSGVERGRQWCSMSCHIMSVHVCIEGSVSSFLSHYVTSICFCDHQL